MTARSIPIGTWRGVSLDVAAWDGVGAEVDLSVACLFEHEPDGGTLQGGARHLDDAMGGALQRLRGDGSFRARSGDTLLIDRPPTGISATAVLVVGLGDPTRWTRQVSAQAVKVAAACALARGSTSAAFAPSLLDAGVRGGDAASAMLLAISAAIDAADAAAQAGLAEPLALRRFVFDAGAAHLEGAADAFATGFAALGRRER
jgi:hypothetical protein